MNRSFKIVSINNCDVNIPNIYHGTRPNQAALKAFNWYCRKTNCNDTIHFVIVEIFNDKNGKKYYYTAQRIKLDVPKQLVRNGKTYSVNYDTLLFKKKQTKNANCTAFPEKVDQTTF